jgi:hypothetical protein
VPLATLHCHGTAQTLWRLLRTPANFLHWTQFCSMLSNIFSPHSAHASLENFHHIKQTTSITNYIQRFEETMDLMQMDYPNLSEPYFVSSFIADLREGIKHYLIPHSPQNLCDAYWKAKELEKGILAKKSLMTPTSTFPKPTNTTFLPKPHSQPQPTTQPNQKPPPFKTREPGKYWGCNENWTHEHKFLCKFRRVVHAMSINPKDWLAMEQAMDDENHVLLQTEVTEPDPTQQPQLLLISSHVVNGTSSSTTFSLLVIIGGKKGVALVDSGSTHTFIDYTFAIKTSCSISLAPC